MKENKHNERKNKKSGGWGSLSVGVDRVRLLLLVSHTWQDRVLAFRLEVSVKRIITVAPLKTQLGPSKTIKPPEKGDREEGCAPQLVFLEILSLWSHAGSKNVQN